MREILFRGKRKDNGKWAEGNLFNDDLMEGNRIFVGGIVIEEYKGPAEDKWDITEIDFCEVDPETVGEYTGLSDKNGKRIFEGDILKCCDKFSNIEFAAVMVFGNSNYTYTWGWKLKPISGGASVNTDILLRVEMDETSATAEIIGNIHDNPELLEEK